MSQTTEKRSRFSHFGGWIAELVLVFVGRVRSLLVEQLSAAPAGRATARSNPRFARAGIAQRNRERKNCRRERRTTSGRVSTRARCRRNAAAASICFYHRLQS